MKAISHIPRTFASLALVLALTAPLAAQEPDEAQPPPQPEAPAPTKNPAGMRKLFAIMKAEPCRICRCR
jgi:hypothetical protein